MDSKILLSIFTTVFIAELGDKTQLSTMLFAADKEVSKWTVFLGSAGALVVASALGVAFGGVISNFLSERTLKVMAGIGFIVIGAWTLIKRG